MEEDIVWENDDVGTSFKVSFDAGSDESFLGHGADD